MSRRSYSPWGAIAVLGAISGAIGVAVLVGHPSSRAAPASPRVALIGDSYAVGLGPELTKLLPDFRAEGHEGTSGSQWASHSSMCGTCGDWLAAFRPAIVLVSLGVNDGATPNPASFQAIVRSLHGIGARVVWVEPPATVSAPAARGVIASLGIKTVPATTTPLAADGLHPRSYSSWAREIAAAIA